MKSVPDDRSGDKLQNGRGHTVETVTSQITCSNPVTIGLPNYKHCLLQTKLYFLTSFSNHKNSEYDQEIPQLQTADKPMA